MLKPGRPTKQNSNELSRRIVEVGTRMFLDKGYAGTTIDELAMVLGASKRSLYSRFANKAEFFRAVTVSYAEQALRTIPDEAATARSAEDRLYNGCLDLLGIFLEPDTIAIERIIVNEAAQFPEIVPILESARLSAMRYLYPPLATLGCLSVDDPRTSEAAQMPWDLTIAAQVRGAALGLGPMQVTEQTRAELRRRVSLFLRGYSALDDGTALNFDEKEGASR